MPLRDPALLEKRLNDFAPHVRRDALAALAALRGHALPAAGGDVNMHCHSFFSYHAEGWSPARIAWECRKRGLYAAGLCDFDVLDGLDEFLASGRALGLRAVVHLETRAFIRELASVEINSPGEPGVVYIMGAGFHEQPAEATCAGKTLGQLRLAARKRNEALVARINARLPELAIDYARDVLPLTPRQVATERHIIRAYAAAGHRAFADAPRRAAFWSPLLRRPPEACLALERDQTAFEESLRGALAKRGGIGYQQPDEKTFPPVDAFIAWVRDCRAIPTVAWLDGTSRGESDCHALLDQMTGKGCAAINIIPDRNWNIRNADEKAVKTARLDELVAAAAARGLPLNIGTEMNRAGLPFADDLAQPALSRHAAVFLFGARIMVGHTVLSLYADAPLLGERARDAFKTTDARNRFYAAVGALPPVTEDDAHAMLDAGPDRTFARFYDAAAREGAVPC